MERYRGRCLGLVVRLNGIVALRPVEQTGDGCQPLPGQKHVGGDEAGRGTALHRNAHVGRLQRRCVVYAVAYHRNRVPEILFQASDERPFFLRAAPAEGVLSGQAEAGGTVTVPRMAIPGVGWVGYALDTEGNPFGVFRGDPQAA